MTNLHVLHQLNFMYWLKTYLLQLIFHSENFQYINHPTPGKWGIEMSDQKVILGNVVEKSSMIFPQ